MKLPFLSLKPTYVQDSFHDTKKASSVDDGHMAIHPPSDVEIVRSGDGEGGVNHRGAC